MRSTFFLSAESCELFIDTNTDHTPQSVNREEEDQLQGRYPVSKLVVIGGVVVRASDL